jgi:hypothetical protein
MIGAVLGGGYLLAQYLDIVNLAVIIFFIILGLISIFGIGTILYGGVWIRMRDAWIMRSIAPPSVVTRRWVYGICDSLRSSTAKVRFLDQLRTARVQLAKNSDPRSKLYLENREVAEAMARLEEQWLDLVH